jgi:hypothetical protein
VGWEVGEKKGGGGGGGGSLFLLSTNMLLWHINVGGRADIIN